MAYTKTVWVDKAVQFFNRFTKTNETSTSVTLTQDPGTVTQAGTVANAGVMNKIEQGIADAHTTADAAVKRNGDTMSGKLNFTDVVTDKIGLYSGYGMAINGAELTIYHPNSSKITVRDASATGPIIGDILTTATYRTTNGFVEWNNAGTWQGVGGVKNVQRGTASWAPTSTPPLNITISAVSSMAKASVNFNTTGSISGTTATITANLTSTNNLAISSSGTSGTAITIAWEVIEYY